MPPVPPFSSRFAVLLAVLPGLVSLGCTDDPPSTELPTAEVEPPGETEDAPPKVGQPVELFDGKTLAGWEGEAGLWTVEELDGVPTIVGTSPGLDHNTFLTTERTFGDFDLSFEIKLTPNEANSGVQFRSERFLKNAEEGETPGLDSEMRGYQADAAAGWWGKLYEESARGLLYPAKGNPDHEAAEDAVMPNEWNLYRIRAEGDHIQTWINGEPSVDLVDPEGRKEGLIGLQLHSGDPLTVRFRMFQMKTL
ncbi:3-keto-disaccharide hydrolase [Alienimonas chondri]|uniref:3-keto-alpha-glucoside-1,2-lyase/3-keto-2-hydroxy-glucal hydratase domain-containing protein n=1 Tax=Alienimonas chondri TaxID=2681879 RepID=A0ABX1VHB1_9PLAN|nr:DUF1080 domain-containing protein [Alienimonas chondri]NNJ27228.1 hypothetical protein [Alienimonas chondri]